MIAHLRVLAGLAFLSFSILVPTLVSAQEIKTVRHATESWGGFTNEDGTGLYHELFRAIFGEFGVEVDVNYVPLKRAVSMVEAGRADLTGGFNKDKRNFARYPVFETNISALFFKENISSWKGVETLKGLRLVGPPETAKASGLPVIEVDSRSQAANMVLKGRADVYIDLLPILSDFRNTGKMISSGKSGQEQATEFQFDRDKLAIETVNLTQLFMLFSDNPRGENVKKMYEEGTRRLHADGRLEVLYKKFNFQTPTVE